MSSMLIRIIAGAVALLVLTIAAMFVLQLGPFNTRPSAAAKVQPKVAAAVAKTQGHAAASVAKVEAKAQAKAVDTQKRIETHVAKIRAAPDGGSDAEFFASVCDTELYEGSADCRRYRR